MGKIIKKKGIVLKTTDYKENALLLTILTSEGIVNLILRGAKKQSSKNRNLSNILSFIEFNQTESNSINTLTEGFVINSFSCIYQDIIKFYY